MKHDKFMEICNSKSYTVPATNMTDKPRELHSTNFLISNWRARGYVYRDGAGHQRPSSRHPRRATASFRPPCAAAAT
ncbi:MAG: hypothetical protein ACLRSD_04855 [Oscillibacter sp.]